jgi:putative ABC transport system permease protein
VNSRTGTLPSLPRVARLRATDLVGVGLLGLRARPLRAALSALGIAIGIAAMVGDDSGRQPVEIGQ